MTTKLFYSCSGDDSQHIKHRNDAIYILQKQPKNTHNVKFVWQNSTLDLLHDIKNCTHLLNLLKKESGMRHQVPGRGPDYNLNSIIFLKF